MLYEHAAELDFKVTDLQELPPPARVLLTEPDYYEVRYVINPHMQDNVGTVDRSEAANQWHRLRDAYEQLGFQPMVVAPAEGQPDMVFCANQSLPYLDPATGERSVVLSQMYAPQRRGEVTHYGHYFESLGYTVHQMPDDVGPFEGMGDALWHVGRELLWGGYGYRTSKSAYEYLTHHLGVPVVLLRLDDPDFYHLDTCLSILDAETALYFPGAFDAAGRSLLERLFPRLIEVPDDEARHRFACNAHCPDGRHVLVQRGSTVANERLRAAGFVPIELETGEFIKAGGSVFCMKLMVW